MTSCLFALLTKAFFPKTSLQVDSVEFPGQKHRWIVTQILMKGKKKTHCTMLDNLAYPKGIILRVDIIDHRCVQRCLQSVWSVQAFPKHLQFQWGELYKNVCVHIIQYVCAFAVAFHSIGVAAFNGLPNSKLLPTS